MSYQSDTAERIRDGQLARLRQQCPRVAIFERWNVEKEHWVLEGHIPNGDTVIKVTKQSLSHACDSFLHCYKKAVDSGLLKHA